MLSLTFLKPHTCSQASFRRDRRGCLSYPSQAEDDFMSSFLKPNQIQTVSGPLTVFMGLSVTVPALAAALSGVKYMTHL